MLDTLNSAREIFEYSDKNTKLKNWRMSLTQSAMGKMNAWLNESESYDNYYPIVVNFNRHIGAELMSMLEVECKVRANYQDSLQAADKICQDIGRKLTETIRLRGDYNSIAIFRVNHLDESLMYLGPSEDDNYQLFLDNGIMMTEGYNAYMRSNSPVTVKNGNPY